MCGVVCGMWCVLSVKTGERCRAGTRGRQDRLNQGLGQTPEKKRANGVNGVGRTRDGIGERRKPTQQLIHLGRPALGRRI